MNRRKKSGRPGPGLFCRFRRISEQIGSNKVFYKSRARAQLWTSVVKLSAVKALHVSLGNLTKVTEKLRISKVVPCPVACVKTAEQRNPKTPKRCWQARRIVDYSWRRE